MRSTCLVLSVLCLTLTDCGMTPPDTATVIADIQTAYGIGKGLVNAQIAAGSIPATDAAAIQKIEAIDDPLVASLSSTTPPTSLSAILTDLQTLTSKLPPGQTTTDLQTALLVAQAAYVTYQGTAPKTN
jgi:hypothetical protein